MIIYSCLVSSSPFILFVISLTSTLEESGYDQQSSPAKLSIATITNTNSSLSQSSNASVKNPDIPAEELSMEELMDEFLNL